MARTPAVAGGRDVVITIRVSRREAALIDAARAGLKRGVWGRIALVRAASSSPTDPR